MPNEEVEGYRNKEIRALTWQQKYDEAVAEYHDNMVRMGATIRAGADGTSIEKSLSLLAAYITWLENKVVLRKTNWMQFQFYRSEGIPFGDGLPGSTLI